VRAIAAVLNLNVEEFMVEFKDGSIRNVGPPTKSATAKLFDVETAEARAFGDSQVKLIAEDEDGNEVQVALFPEQVAAIVEDVESLRDDSPVFE
jgi:hypothetical protein